jgi:YggT family protein
MNAIFYIVETLLSLAVFVFLLRLLLQWARADFRNQLAQAVVKITNPLVMPLRRVLPPVGKVDTASVVAVLFVAFVEEAILLALTGSFHIDPFWLARAVVLRIIVVLITTYFYAIIIYALLSFVAPGNYSPMNAILTSLCEPILRPFRRVIPPIGGIDFSPLWATILLGALLRLL